MSFPNVYTHRKVADTSSKSCDVCYRATTSVLLAEGPDGKDFFFVCPAHLKDSNFCSPIIDQAAIDARKKKELDEELERVKKEYEEKQKAKKEKEKEKEKEKDDKDKKDEDKDKDSKEKDKDKDKTKDDKAEEKADDKAEKDKADTSTPKASDEPRVFALHRNFYGQRVEKRRQQEMTKRNRERLQNPNLFPSVPKGLPGS